MFKRSIFIIAFVSLGLFILPLFFPLSDGYVVESKDGYISILEGVSDSDEKEEEDIEFGKPVYITISSVGIELEVKEGVYDSDKLEWSIDDGYAYWANLSDEPSLNLGNSLVYAHNKGNAFYFLKDLEYGDLISLKTEKGYTLVYQYVESRIVGPYDDDLFTWDDGNFLTLLTCYGFGSTQRKLYISEFIEYKVNQ